MDSFVHNRKILYVDDEASLLSSFTSLMRKKKVQATVLNDSTHIDAVLEASGPFAVVLSDQRMPGLDGVEVLARVVQSHPDTVRILVTGYSDHRDTLRAINEGGISRYVSKPWNDEELQTIVEDAISQYNLKRENRYLMAALDRENARLAELLEGTIVGTSRILGDVVGSLNPEGAAQMSRVRRLGNTFLDMLNQLTSDERWEISRALDLFNLGLAVLPPQVQASINKEGLAGLERSAVARNHHLLAAGLLKGIPRFEGVARIIELHRKDFDGSGVPTHESIKGQDIPLGARLLHILVDLDKYTLQRVPGRVALNRMLAQPSKYDVSLLQLMLGGTTAQQASGNERAMHVTSLQPGMILIDDVVTHTGQLLLRAGSTLSDTSVNILWQWHKNDPIVEPIRVREQG